MERRQAGTKLGKSQTSLNPESMNEPDWWQLDLADPKELTGMVCSTNCVCRCEWRDDDRAGGTIRTGVSIIFIEDEEQAVGIANGTGYGQINCDQCADKGRREMLAKRLRSGMIERNGQQRAAGSPFGGIKASGNGREGGVLGLEKYLKVKAFSGWPNEAGNGKGPT